MKNNTNFFICPWASKAGTCTLYYILKLHPELPLSNIKETYFFVNEQNFKKEKDFYLSTYFENNNKLNVRIYGKIE